MPIVPSIAIRAAAKAATWEPLRNAIAGAAAFFVKHYNDQAAEPALEVWSTHASGTAPVFWARYSLNGTKGVEILQNGVTLRSPDATKTVAVTNAGVTISGLNVGARDYSVLDHGLVTGATSASAAANTSALQNLWATVCAAGGGRIVFPPGEYPLNATVLDHQLGFSRSVSLVGATGGSSLLKFYGATGVLLDISPTSSSPLFQCGIFDLRILHGDTRTAGATIRLGYTSRYHIDRVLMDANGAFIALQLIASASVHAHDSTFTVRDVANAATIDFAQTVASGGVQFTGCDISGGGTTNTRGLRFSNTALVDTIVLNGTSIKDHAIGIASTANTGDIQNFQMNGGHIDGTGTCISIQPSTGADYGTIVFNGVWMSGDTQIAIFSAAGGGTVSGVVIGGESWHNATQGGITIQDGVSTVKLTGINMDLSNTNNASYSGVLLEDTGAAGVPNRVTITGCTIAVGSSTAACITVAAAADPVCIVGNDLIGGADADGIVPGAATSASRVIANNSYTA